MESSQIILIPFHLGVPLLYEVCSRMNIRTITDKFPHKINICFVHLLHKDFNQKQTEDVSVFFFFNGGF